MCRTDEQMNEWIPKVIRDLTCSPHTLWCRATWVWILPGFHPFLGTVMSLCLGLFISKMSKIVIRTFQALWESLGLVKQEESLVACISLYSTAPGICSNHIHPLSWCFEGALLPCGIWLSLFFTYQILQPPVKKRPWLPQCRLPQSWARMASYPQLCQNAYIIL